MTHDDTLRTICIATVLALIPVAASPAQAPADKGLDLTRTPQTIAFLGDSITHGGRYHEYIQLFLATRYPGLDLWTVNVGRSGEDAFGALTSMFDEELTPYKPDVVFIHFGMNDVGRNSFLDKPQPPSDEQRHKTRDKYRVNMGKLLQRVREIQARAIVLSPTIFDDTVDRWDNNGQRPHLNAELALLGRYGRELATQSDAGFVDLHTLMDQVNRREQAKDASFSLTADRVHPRRGGEEVMLYTILQAMKVRGVVYDVSLSADGKPARQDGATVSDVQAATRQLRFTLAETALPFPIPRDNRGFSLVPFAEELNRQRLAVTGLPAGRYDLLIDNQPVGAYTAEQWAQGVELSGNDKTPQYQAAAALREMILGRKLELERAVRDMFSMRMGLKSAKADTGIDWNNVDPEKVVSAIDALHQKLTQEGKQPKRWSAYVFKAGRAGFARYHAIHKELAQIREHLRQQPARMKHTYHIQPAQ